MQIGNGEVEEYAWPNSRWTLFLAEEDTKNMRKIWVVSEFWLRKDTDFLDDAREAVMLNAALNV
jgi:hypothetical protein